MTLIAKLSLHGFKYILSSTICCSLILWKQVMNFANLS